MKIKLTNRFAFSLILPLLLFVILLVHLDSKHEGIVVSSFNNSSFSSQTKLKGMHDFGVRENTDFAPLKQTNVEWITLVPWGFQDDINSPRVTHHNKDSLRMRRHDSSWVKRITQVHDAGFKVFLKPHLWIDNPSDGKWRSDIFHDNEQDWKEWQKTYRNFILRYARIAQEAEAEMFCIGMEFSKLTKEYPEYWIALIDEIRSVYFGEITYGANWYKEYEDVEFWQKLDYIGVQAYFPLVKDKNPSITQLSKGWKHHLRRLKRASKKYNRQILFTEMGYKSTDDSAIEPWKWSEYSEKAKKAYSIETQANCFEAFFNVVWPEPWFAGVHIWQWRSDLRGVNRKYNTDFTPQGKPAVEIIAKGFK